MSCIVRLFLCVVLSSLLGVGNACASEAIRFEEVYKKPFYQSEAFTNVAITAVIAGSAAYTTLTAGAGAPTAAIGVSSLASWVGGGGAGSYMAGLSVVGRLIGGNAIAGAAALNATSTAILGSGSRIVASRVTKSGARNIPQIIGRLVLKHGDKIQFVAGNVIGIYRSYLANQKSVVYSLPLHIPTEFGSELYTFLPDAASSNTVSKEQYEEINSEISRLAEIRLKREDQIMTAILLYQLARYDKFMILVDSMECNEGDSFVYYMKGLSSFLKGNYAKAEHFATQAHYDEPEALEPVLLLALLGDSTGRFSTSVYLKKIEGIEIDHYVSPNSLATTYSLLGDLAVHNKQYEAAIKCYLMVLDEHETLFQSAKDQFAEWDLFGQVSDISATIHSKISFCYAKIGDRKLSRKYFLEALQSQLDEDVLVEIEKRYLHSWYVQ